MVQIEREYVAGACNISKEEEARRLSAGWMGLGTAVVLEALFVAFNVPAPWRLFVFLPAAGAASGFLQVAFHFCAAYGFKGVFNVAAPVGTTTEVSEENKALDRAKAFQIFGLSSLIGVAAALAAFFIV